MLAKQYARVCRLIDQSTTAKHLDHFVRLNADARSNIEWWFKFAGSWNGITMTQAIIRSAPSTTFTSDASGNWGCGAGLGLISDGRISC